MSVRMPHLFLLFASACFVLHSVSGRSIHAADGADEAATIDLATDFGYGLLGEFSGRVLVGEKQYEPLALQIRPVGGDNFEALQFRGGLPGQKAHQPKAMQLIGRRAGDTVVLSGAPWAIFVEKDQCLLIDSKGKRVGRLKRIVRRSPTLGAKAPLDAVILFDGSGTEQFTTANMTADGLLMEGADLKPMFQDFNLHAEFRLPYMPTADGQARANSGLYLQSRYELQVLDSFATLPVYNGLGSIYRTRKPDVNMAFPPLQWQTYDVEFTAPRWVADGTKIRNAHVTAWVNGIKVQDDVELPNKTGAGQEEAPTLLPTKIQDHNNPVRFRNIWLIDRGLAPAAKFPIRGKVKPKAEKPAPTSKAKKAEPVPKEKPLEKPPAPASEEKPTTVSS